MRVEDLIDAIGAIDPEHVREAEEWGCTSESRSGIRAVRKMIYNNRKILLPLAACFCLVAAGSAYGLLRNGSLFMGNEGMSGGAAAGGVESAADDGDGADAGTGMDAGGKSGDSLPGAEAADVPGESADTTGSADGADGAAQPADTAEDAEMFQQESAEADRRAEDRIVINEVESLQSAIYCGPAPETELRVMPEELADIYGVAVLPGELPDGYELDAPAEGYVIAYDEDGRLFDDHITLSCINRTTNGSFTISVRTTESGTITTFASDDLAESVIGGNEVTIGHYPEGTSPAQTDGYLAIFEKQGVIFAVQSSGMEEGAFLALLTALQ